MQPKDQREPAQVVAGSPAPGLAFAFRVTLTVGPPVDHGEFEGRRRRAMPITGGKVEGPGFQGSVLALGADWQSIRIADGTAFIDARHSFRHDDGTVVAMTNVGVRRGPPEVLAKLAAGEAVDPAAYYFRASPRFDAPPGPHGWLADNTFVCVGRRGPEGVELDIYRVL